MEIKGPGRVGSSGVTRKTKKGTSDKAAFNKALETDETTSSGMVSGTAPLTAVNSLLALQESGTATDGRSKGLAKVEDLLSHLDLIRQGLLLGHIPKGRLNEVLNVVNSQQDQVDDDALNEILDDVELRVKVELAKLEVF